QCRSFNPNLLGFRVPPGPDGHCRARAAVVEFPRSVPFSRYPERSFSAPEGRRSIARGVTPGGEAPPRYSHPEAPEGRPKCRAGRYFGRPSGASEGEKIQNEKLI